MEEKKSEKKGNDIFWIIGIIAVIVGTYLIGSYVYTSVKGFDYEGMRFERESFGGTTVYIYNYNSVVNNQVFSVELLLRNDPRRNKVPVETNEIFFPEKETVYFAINSTGLQCSQSLLSMGSITQFVTMNGMKTLAGTADENEAEEENIDFISCEKFPNNAVINIRSADRTYISGEGNCYYINVANCEILEAVEKFQIQTIIDAKNYYG